MKALFLLPLLLLPLLWFFFLQPRLLPLSSPIDSYKGVAVYANGNNYVKSHGRHYHWSGYYYGQKWQCVEFIKRFLFLAHNHRMPNVWGNATDFFEPKIPSGEINPERGMLQYANGGPYAPQPDDLIVFKNLTPYGHVAIITEVTAESITMIQQNVGANTRMTLPLLCLENKYYVGDEKLQATGWLRISLIPHA